LIQHIEEKKSPSISVEGLNCCKNVVIWWVLHSFGWLRLIECRCTQKDVCPPYLASTLKERKAFPNRVWERENRLYDAEGESVPKFSLGTRKEKFEKGKQEGVKETAKAMLHEGMDISLISKITQV
jgi:hypothetical protein